jgi:hypothetical protein
VQTTIFAARIGADNQGFGVPTQLVEQRLAGAGSRPVSTGACVG